MTAPVSATTPTKKAKEEERKTVRLTAGALLVIVILAAVGMSVIVTIDHSPILIAMLNGAMLTTSLVVVYAFAPGLLRNLRSLASGVYLLRLGIVISWLINTVSSSLRIIQGLVTDAPFSIPFHGYIVTMLIIAGVLHVSAIGMMEGKPLWRNIWIALWFLVVGTGFTGLIAWIDTISDIEATPYILYGVYDIYLVTLSIVVAIVGSYFALAIMQRATATTGAHKVTLLCVAGLVMGSSIWTMHFTGMLAFTLPGFHMEYDLLLTLFSFLLPVAVTTMGFLAASFGIENGSLRTIGSGALVALGIVGMHYVGMAAMEINGVGLTYDYLWVVISLVVALIASVVALWFAFTETTRIQRAVAATVLGAAGVAGLHYSAMVGAIFFRVGVPEWP